MRRQTRSPRRTALVGAAVLVGATALLALDFMGVLSGLVNRGPDTTLVRAVFTDAKQLHKGDPVRLHGVTVGTVDAITLDRAGAQAVVSMKVDSRRVQLFADARVDIRWRTVLGGAFAVRLEPGTRAAGPLDGGVVPVTRTSSQVELEDVLSFNRGRARAGLRALPGALATALSDPDAPAAALRRLADVAPDATRGLRAVRGRMAGRDLPELVVSADATVRALDTREDAIARVVAGAAATLRTTAARRRELSESFRRAPAALQETEATLTGLDGTLDVADPLLAELERPAGEVAATVAELRPALVGADRLLQRARPLLRALRPAAAALGAAADVARPLLDDLRPSLGRLDEKVLPYFSTIDPDTKHSLAEMVGPALSQIAGSTGQLDQNGHFLRFPATTGSSPLYSLPCQTYVNNPDAKSLVVCQSLQEALNTVFSYNPLGATPGTSALRKAGRR